MDESTTNDTPQGVGAVDAQPNTEDYTAADATDSELNETTDQTEADETGEVPAPSEANDPTDYWAKKGIDITTPEGLAKATKSYQEAEKSMTQKAQQASELAKKINEQPLEIDTDNELVRQALEKSNALETTLAVKEWKESKHITPEQDAALGQYVTDNPNKAYLLRNGMLTLDDIYNMSGVGNVDTSEARKQGGVEALQNLSSRQRANANQGNAVNSTPSAPLNASNVESWWDGLGTEGRKDPANIAKLDAILG
jgi:hypothetical protein